MGVIRGGQPLPHRCTRKGLTGLPRPAVSGGRAGEGLGYCRLKIKKRMVVLKTILVYNASKGYRIKDPICPHWNYAKEIAPNFERGVLFLFAGMIIEI